MAKIAQISAKYIIHASIHIDGIVDRPDVIGAIFGQTEGLLGADLELRELQRSGRIGRIEVNVDTRSGKTDGEIIIPSSLDKAETAIVGAALEIIERIGPCNAKIRVSKIEDVRITKRKFVVERAKDLLKNLTTAVLPDSQELADEVSASVRVMEIREYGRERLPAGPMIDEGDEIIVVEGRADVMNLLKHGFKNAISMNGTSVPQTIIELSKRKTLTVFVDGDRGGNLIIQELLAVAEVDFITKAPDGKEVEELAQKEIHKALRGRITGEQARLEIPSTREVEQRNRGNRVSVRDIRTPPPRQQERPDIRGPPTKTVTLADDEKQKFSSMLEDLIGTRGAYVLDDKLNILGKVPISELPSTIKSLKTGIHAIVMDGVIEKDLVSVAEKADVDFLVAMDKKATANGRTQLLTAENLE